MTGNEMYEMKLHESKLIDDETPVDVRRVPGGWIYTMFYAATAHSVFVPLNNEFVNLNQKSDPDEF